MKYSKQIVKSAYLFCARFLAHVSTEHLYIVNYQIKTIKLQGILAFSELENANAFDGMQIVLEQVRYVLCNTPITEWDEWIKERLLRINQTYWDAAFSADEKKLSQK